MKTRKTEIYHLAEVDEGADSEEITLDMDIS
jgi:hypothetical protein